MMTKILILSIFFMYVTVAYTAKPNFVLITDKADAIYKPGEKIKFQFYLMQNGKTLPGKHLAWSRMGDDGKITTGEVNSGLEIITVVTTINKPGFVRLIIKAKENKSDKQLIAFFSGGVAVSPNKLKGISEPKDFDNFWIKQKQRLKQIMMKIKMKPISVKNSKLLGFDVKVACAGRKPVSGYFFKPKNTKPKSLPAILNFHGYGVGRASRNENFASRGMLSFDINAHGIDNDKNKEYYKKLKQTKLKNYGFKNNEKREESYFLDMTLRIMRALEFIKAQPEWDGKNLIVTGGSQGGFQALVAAGLDQQVSFCIANKPWLCDLGGVTLNRLKGWRPKYTRALDYFDPANHAKRIKCKTIIDIGLGDYVCPPSGVTVMYNNIKAPKKIFYIQGGTHSITPKNAKTSYEDLKKHLNDICKGI